MYFSLHKKQNSRKICDSIESRRLSLTEDRFVHVCSSLLHTQSSHNCLDTNYVQLSKVDLVRQGVKWYKAYVTKAAYEFYKPYLTVGQDVDKIHKFVKQFVEDLDNLDDVTVAVVVTGVPQAPSKNAV